MSSTIPYDPSITLGNIVTQTQLASVQAIKDAQAPVDSAQAELNSALQLKHQLMMTLNELSNLGIDTSGLDESITGVNDSITTAAADYAKKAAASLPIVSKLRTAINKSISSIESPVDFNKSNLKRVPIAADSIWMDAQYFSFDQTGQSDKSVMASMKSFVSASTSFLGNKRSGEITAAMQNQVNQQREFHNIQGTLVIVATCTHKNANLFAPFIMDVDKGIRAWNEMVRLKELKADLINTEDPKAFKLNAEKAGTEEEVSYQLISGATYGSSFVGMVHVLNESSTESSQQMFSAAASLQAQMKVGSWFSSMEGGFGVNSSFSNSAKRLLSSQKISSHVSLVVMGVIPTIVASEVQLAVKQFTDFSPDKMMGQLAALQNSTASDQASVAESAASARTGAQMMSIRTSELKSVMTAVGEIDDGKNKMLDINTLMTAFTDFVQKAAAGEAGVPIKYFLKPITANQLYQMWVAKYFPATYVTSAGDDTTPDEPKNDVK